MQSLYCLLWEDEFKGERVNEGDLDQQQQRELEEVLKQFPEVFQDIIGLPPKREIMHSIVLTKEGKPVSVHPYSYPYHPKEEIERQVQYRMELGIIRHSSSVFSRPIILVKKKDASWRMCVDYRELNKVTVPDKYPILVVEKLLDELHGASYFSKLDLKLGYHKLG